MDYDKKLNRYVWTKEDWLYSLPAIMGGIGGVGFIILCRWWYTGLLFPFS